MEIPTNYGQELFSWAVPEYKKHEKTKIWYFSACTIGLLMLIYSFVTANFLFAVIIIIASLIMILHDKDEPAQVQVSITTEGIVVGRKFYDYDEIKNFSFVYKPRLDIKNLYFEFKSPLQHRLSFSIGDLDPLPIRENLLQYIPEDLEREDIPVSENLSRLLKL